MKLEDMLQDYNRQALAMFGGKNTNDWAVPRSNDYIPSLNKAVGAENAAGLFYSGSGFFVDCCLEAPIVNTTLNPIYSLANMIPVFPTTDRKVTYGFLTTISANTGSYPDYVCDDSPAVGDPTFCKMEFDIGRISYQTKTLELDALIEKACRGVREDFYLVGNIRGTSAIPTLTQLADRDFVQRAAVRRQLMLIGRAFQNDIIRQFWVGDPTSGTQNTTHGGRKEFWGLMHLIDDDYASKTGVTGTSCAALNSDVKTFEGCVGDGGVSLFGLMQELEDTVYQRAAMMGLLPTDWVWVMHPITWAQLVKYLPCEMLGDSCIRPGYDTGTGSTIQITGDNSINFLRQQMMTTMQLPINGRTYTVVLDHGIPLTETVVAADPEADPPVEASVSYTGSIFFVPLRVAGEPALYWRYKDYTGLDQQLSPIPGDQTAMRGWTDGGKYHFIVAQNRRCFVVDGKTELGLVFIAPQLSGRIDSVCVNPKQVKPHWFAGSAGLIS